jgi:hypothetical protein
MQKVLAVKAAEQFEGHMCSNGRCGHVFPKRDRKEWHAHVDETCEHCRSSRFKVEFGHPRPTKRSVQGQCIAIVYT